MARPQVTRLTVLFAAAAVGAALVVAGAAVAAEEPKAPRPSGPVIVQPIPVKPLALRGQVRPLTPTKDERRVPVPTGAADARVPKAHVRKLTETIATMRQLNGSAGIVAKLKDAAPAPTALVLAPRKMTGDVPGGGTARLVILGTYFARGHTLDACHRGDYVLMGPRWRTEENVALEVNGLKPGLYLVEGQLTTDERTDADIVVRHFARNPTPGFAESETVFHYTSVVAGTPAPVATVFQVLEGMNTPILVTIRLTGSMFFQGVTVQRLGQ